MGEAILCAWAFCGVSAPPGVRVGKECRFWRQVRKQLRCFSKLWNFAKFFEFLSSSLSDVACLRFVECTELFRERRFRRAIAERVYGVGLEDKCQMILGSVNGR